MYSLEIVAKNKSGLIEIFEALSHFPDTMMMLKSGEYTVDAHSIIGVYSIDVTRPIELIFETEPTDEIKQTVEKFIPVNA